MKNLIFLFLASATFFSCATSKKQLKFTELKGAFYSLTYSDGTLITSGYTYQNSYEKLGDAQKWINDMKKDSKYKKALEEKITKYNSYYGTNFCIPLEAKPTWSRGTQKELLYVFDVNKLNNQILVSVH